MRVELRDGRVEIGLDKSTRAWNQNLTYSWVEKLTLTEDQGRELLVELYKVLAGEPPNCPPYAQPDHRPLPPVHSPTTYDPSTSSPHS